MFTFSGPPEWQFSVHSINVVHCDWFKVQKAVAPESQKNLNGLNLTKNLKHHTLKGI